MSDRIDPPAFSEWRPWPDARDGSLVYDHGQHWCANADAHPDNHDGYPDPDRHLPWHECRSNDIYIDGGGDDLADEPVGISACLAAPFRYGSPRPAPLSHPRLVLEVWPESRNEAGRRISLPAGEALRLARVLIHLADRLTFVDRPARE